VRLRLPAASAVVAAAVVALGVTTAAAQEADGTITVDEIHPTGASVHYIVRVETDDGEPATDATVTAAATSPDGATGPTVTLVPDSDGRYQGAVDLSENGTWTVTFTATNPDATLDHTQKLPVTTQTSEDEPKEGRPELPLLAGITLLGAAGVALWTVWERRRTPADDADSVTGRSPGGRQDRG
jgi:hypothetical protein